MPIRATDSPELLLFVVNVMRVVISMYAQSRIRKENEKK